MKISIGLAQRAYGSKVWLDGVDISESVRGVTVSAHVHGVSTVTLLLSPHQIEITGEAGEVLKMLDWEQEIQAEQ